MSTLPASRSLPRNDSKKKTSSKSPLWKKRGLIYLEMMFLSYGRLILTSCLPYLLPTNDSKKKSFSKSRLWERGLIYLEMMFLSYGRNRHDFMSNLPSLPRNDFKKKEFSKSPFWGKRSNLPGDDVS